MPFYAWASVKTLGPVYEDHISRARVELGPILSPYRAQFWMRTEFFTVIWEVIASSCIKKKKTIQIPRAFLFPWLKSDQYIEKTSGVVANSSQMMNERNDPSMKMKQPITVHRQKVRNFVSQARLLRFVHQEQI